MAYSGEHASIIDEDLWSSVQRRLEANGVERREKQDAGAPDLLTGILIDANGEPMTPTHAVKKGVRYIGTMCGAASSPARRPKKEMAKRQVNAFLRPIWKAR